MRQFTAQKDDADMRLSRFVQRVTTGVPTSLLYKSFRRGRIKVNGKKARPQDRLQAGDVVEVYLVDEFFAAVQPKKAPAPRRVSFFVVFEDDQLLVVHKPAGLLCHSDNTGDPSLVEGVLRYLQDTGAFDPAAQNTFAPALCNRLDRGTEGLVIAAKTAGALRAVNRLIREGGLTKSYECLALGRCADGVYEAWHFHAPDAKKVQVSRRPKTDPASGQAYRPIRTGVRLMRYNEAAGVGLYRITLYTGRTHQIRAHMRLLGHPLLGDPKYGDAAANRRFGLARQALCAVEVRFGDTGDDPVLARYAGMRITSPHCALAQQLEALTPAAKE